MKTAIGIKEDYLAEVRHSLNIFLADEHVLYVKTRNAHWNVEGSDFAAKHLFFEEQYRQLETVIDDLAERIRTLGHYPEASLRRFLELTHLTEEGREANDSLGFIKLLLNDHDTIIIHLRKGIRKYADVWRDLGSSDYLTTLLELHEKMAWKLRAHLPSPNNH